MNWIVKISKDATRQLKRFPFEQQGRIRQRLREMKDDPFRGNVMSLKDKRWKGRYRKRVGRYRIIFLLRRAERLVEISAILARNERTYR